LTPDEKLSWIQQRNWLYTLDLKHEVFRLLKTAYPEASQPSRSELLEQICRGPQGTGSEDSNDEIRRDEIGNLLSWLHRAAPVCSLVAEKFARYQEVHPDFTPSEHPDLRYWTSSGSFGLQSPLTVEELLAKDPEQEIDWLLNYQAKGAMEVGRRGLLEIIFEAVAQSHTWSWKLVAALQTKEAWSSDLWESIIRGWQIGAVTEEQWKRVLTFLLQCTHIHGAFSFPIANLLQQATRREQPKIPSSCLTSAQNLAEKVWDACSRPPLEESGAAHDWLQRAISHPGGKLVEFWLNILSIQRNEAGDTWAGIPQEAKAFFEKVLNDTSAIAELGRVLLASQLHLLFALEAEWTRRNILPLLDWSVNSKRAQQAWHGFLDWGRWNEALLPDLISLYEKTFPHVKIDLGDQHMRKRFSEDIAHIALFSSHNPLLNGWLSKFLLSVDASDREAWAGHIRHSLRSLPKEAIRYMWDRWMNEYWKQRNAGVPLPPGAAELEQMVGWSVYLKPVFSEAVKQICQIVAPPLRQTLLYHELVREGVAANNPEALSRLLHHLLKKAEDPFLHCYYVEQLVQKLADSSVSRSALLELCNELARLGCKRATELRDLLGEKEG